MQCKHVSSNIYVYCQVIELSVGSAMGKELAIDKIINKFFNELTKASKLTPTGRIGVW